MAGIIADPPQFRRANRRLVQWTKPPARTYMDRLIQFPTDMKCNRNMRAILESTLAGYMDGQQREWGEGAGDGKGERRARRNWRTAGAALNFQASILHIVIPAISIYATIPVAGIAENLFKGDKELRERERERVAES